MNLPEEIKNAVSGFFGNDEPKPLDEPKTMQAVDNSQKQAVLSQTLDKMLEGLTVGDLVEAMKEDQPTVKLGGVDVPCNIAEQLKENVEQVPLADVVKAAAMTGNAQEMMQGLTAIAEVSHQIEAECSPEQIEAGESFTPAPTPSDADKAESMGRIDP